MLKRLRCLGSTLLGEVIKPKTIALELDRSQDASADACIVSMIYKLRKRNSRPAVKNVIARLSNSFLDARKRSGNGGYREGKGSILTLGNHLVFVSILMLNIKLTDPTNVKNAHASNSNQILLASGAIKNLRNIKQFMRQKQKDKPWANQFGKISYLWLAILISKRLL